MELKELIKQKVELEKQMRDLDKQINKYKSHNAVASCETIIKSFEDLEVLMPYEDLCLETYCTVCDTDIDARIEFNEIINAMKILKNRIENRIKQEEK